MNSIHIYHLMNNTQVTKNNKLQILQGLLPKAEKDLKECKYACSVYTEHIKDYPTSEKLETWKRFLTANEKDVAILENYIQYINDCIFSLEKETEMDLQKLYVPPTDIFVHETLNNRDMDQNYITDLTVSMLNKGFLPEFAIDVFRSEALTMIKTDLPFVCACGNHRTKAAQAAKLETVPVNIHPGKEEAFIEMMHLDNFKFDPVQNSQIGQAFTTKEKRNAVHQLLLLPKFFEMTDTALVDTWKIPRSNIRRWRAEVVEMLEADNPLLRIWGISDGRLARVRELAAKPERIDSDGKVVKIRKPVAEVTEDEKEEFWDQIKEDAGGQEGWLAASKIRDFDYVRDYAKEKYNTKESWMIYRYLTMHQMKEIHKAILENDPEFREAVLAIAEADREADKIRKEIKKISDDIKKWLLKQVNDSEWSDNFKKAKAEFQDTVRAQGFFDEFSSVDYHFDPYDYKIDDLNMDARNAVMGTLQTIWNQIDLDSLWVVEFRESLEKKVLNKRQKLVENWKEAKQELIDAIAAFPRPIDLSAVCMAMDNQFYVKKGEFQRIMDTDKPTERMHATTLNDQIKRLRRATKDIKGVQVDGAEIGWVKEIPSVQLITEVNSTETPLAEVFASIKDRVVHLDALHDKEIENELRHQIHSALGKLSRGQLGTKIWILADIGEWIAKCQSGEE